MDNELIMDAVYEFSKVEAEAQQFWAEHGSFRAVEDPAREKFYCLSMLPYPSGKLHMGHVRNYTIGDVLTRFHRMHGRNVLQPMGWDAFGLPAENAAMQNNVPPAKWTWDNINYMRKQLKIMGFALDWEREVATCSPEYYRWNQWLFLRMLEKGIAYLKTGTVNWDPVDQTVLANEQVIEGRGWRTGALVEKRAIPMYYLKITEYAEELLGVLDAMPGWPERVKTMQANWIGRSEGVEIGFPHDDGVLKVFTTRTDTLFGATYVAVAAEHPLALKAAKNNTQLAAFIKECKQGAATEAELATMEKCGMDTGLFVTHPLTGDKLSIWVSNYVLMGYGEGAIMAVPAHDQRDFEFARKYGLPITVVVRDPDADILDERNMEEAFITYDGVTCNSGKYDGLGFASATDAIAVDLAAKDHGKKRVQFRLRDWGISRQRYWGCPIPIVHCDTCGTVPVSDENLPVTLPEDLAPDGSGNPLNKCEAFVNTECPKCGKAARRETDTMDTFVDSSWYFMRYCCADNNNAMVDERTNYWMPVDQYIGGIEHAILHLLYARFWTRVMRDLDLIKVDEPFTNLLTQGMVLNHIYYRSDDAGRIEYFNPADVDVTVDDRGKITGMLLKTDGKPVHSDGLGTMSKSKNNGVDPQDLVDRYGADTVRLFMMFASPPEQTLEWSDTGVEGAARFVKRLWRVVHEHVAENRVAELDIGALDARQRAMRCAVHETLAKVTDDIGRRFTFNTAIAAIMEQINQLIKKRTYSTQDGAIMQEALSIIVQSMSPVIPHACHVMWQALGHDSAVIDSAWPEADEAALVRDELKYVVQVNGKLRGHIIVPVDAPREVIVASATAEPNVLRFIDGKEIRKEIVVPGKLVNLVV